MALTAQKLIIPNGAPAAGDQEMQSVSALTWDGTKFIVGSPAIFQNSSNSTTAFQVLQSGGGIVFNADTTNARVGVGTASPSATFQVGTTPSLSVNTSLNRVGIGTSSLSGALNIGGDRQLIFVGGNAAITSSGFMTIAGSPVLLNSTNVRVNSFDAGANLNIKADVSTRVPIVVRGQTSQSADLIQFQSVTASTLLSVKSSGNLSFGEGVNIVSGTTTGTKIGTATTQKLGFWNATPVVQQAHIADPAGGATVDAEARTAINAINALLATLGLTAAS